MDLVEELQQIYDSEIIFVRTHCGESVEAAPPKVQQPSSLPEPFCVPSRNPRSLDAPFRIPWAHLDCQLAGKPPEHGPLPHTRGE
jgi:hypothetical protein